MAWLVCLALSVPEEPATPLHSNAEGFVWASLQYFI
jgi:hypothetical protein